MVSFDKFSSKEMDQATAIATKAVNLGVKSDLLSLEMDILTAHNDCPLNLDALLNAKHDQDFIHDVTGIQRHLNRKTGKLEDFFLPRYAKNQ